MGVSDIYTPAYLNVDYVTSHNLWDKPMGIVRTEVREQVADGEISRKLVLHLSESTVPLMLNRTNAKVLSTAWGDDYNTWTGKQLRLMKKLVQYRQEEVEAIRVSAV